MQTTAVGSFWHWRVRRVVGTSMLPTLSPGQLIVVDFEREPRVGDIVVATHAAVSGDIVKRLIKIESDGYWLEGDGMVTGTASASMDSWTLGAFSREQIAGVVRARMPRTL